MVRNARYAFAAVAWAFVAGLVAQVFFIGLALFDDADSIELHRTFGYLLQVMPVLMLVAAAVGRTGRTVLLQVVALLVTVFVFPIFPLLRDDLPLIAALHPVGALLAFWLGIVVARRATALVNEPDAMTGAAR